MALLGCNVTVTDQEEVLPLLQRNVDRNTSRVMQKNPGLVLNLWTILFTIWTCYSFIYVEVFQLNVIGSYSFISISLKNLLLLESFGSIKVSVLQWGDESHIKDVDPPFDYIIGTDVVSVEQVFFWYKVAWKTNSFDKL